MIRSWADAFGGTDASVSFSFMAGTTANSLQVGVTKTEAVNRQTPDALEMIQLAFLPKMSIPRLGEVEDVPDVVCLLVRREARWITGSAVAADGGCVKVC